MLEVRKRDEGIENYDCVAMVVESGEKKGLSAESDGEDKLTSSILLLPKEKRKLELAGLTIVRGIAT